MKTVEKEKLWEEYQKNPSAELREKIIIEYAPLVRVVAGLINGFHFLHTTPVSSHL